MAWNERGVVEWRRQREQTAKPSEDRRIQRLPTAILHRREARKADASRQSELLRVADVPTEGGARDGWCFDPADKLEGAFDGHVLLAREHARREVDGGVVHGCAVGGCDNRSRTRRKS